MQTAIGKRIELNIIIIIDLIHALVHVVSDNNYAHIYYLNYHYYNSHTKKIEWNLK